jgi:hypothetical protein
MKFITNEQDSRLSALLNKGKDGTHYTGQDKFRRPDPNQWFWGVIFNLGPNGEVDFTDNRYWFKSALINNTTASTDATVISQEKVTSGIIPSTEDGVANPWFVWAAATNMAEDLAGSHFLPHANMTTPQLVKIWWDYDVSTDPGNASLLQPKVRYLIDISIFPRPQYQGMIWQGVAQGQIGFDWGRAHPALV